MTKKERRMWVRWFNRNFKRRPKMYYECNDGYFRRSRRIELHGELTDFGETYFFIRNRRSGLGIRDSWLSVKWSDVQKFLRFKPKVD